MKITLIWVAILSTFLTGCDREMLKGLNLKFQGELSSDYKQEDGENQESSQSNSSGTEINPSQAESSNEVENKAPEVFRNQPVQEVKNESNYDPDAPLPFNVLKDCSQAGMTAQTNKIFYAQNSNLKSINSKNEQQVKQWKSIFNQIKSKCESN
jgi:hypothetical protein